MVENISDKYLEAFAPIGAEEYERIFARARERAMDKFQVWKLSDSDEIERCIVDAVHCGLQEGLGIQVPLVSEEIE